MILSYLRIARSFIWLGMISDSGAPIRLFIPEQQAHVAEVPYVWSAGPLNNVGLTLIPDWVIYQVPSKVGIRLIIHP